MASCFVKGCKGSARKDKAVSFHRFPGLDRSDVRQKWLDEVGAVEKDLPKFATVCSRHFDSDCFFGNVVLAPTFGLERRHQLKRNAVPTIFDDWPEEKKKIKLCDEQLEEQPGSLLQEDEVIQELESREDPGGYVPYSSLKHDHCYSLPAINQRSSQSASQDDSPNLFDSENTMYSSEADDINDPPYQYPSSSSQESLSGQQSTRNPLHMQNTYLVYEDNLMGLMKFCKSCGSPVNEETITKFHNGTQVGFSYECLNGCKESWKTQPEIGKVQHTQGAGNILLTAAIVLSGMPFQKFKQFSYLLNLPCISEDTFGNIRDKYVLPEIENAWEAEQQNVINEAKESGVPVMLAGDGRSDSPGHSAKYGTYTMINTANEKVIDFEVVQVTEVKNSTNMEKEGFIRTLTRIEDKHNVEIKGVSTDGHLQIKKYMREEQKEKEHEMDPWHMIKGTGKKLYNSSKKKSCTELVEWIPSIKNHFWWSVETCDGNPDILTEKWTSVVHHVSNRHEWVGAKHYKACPHEKLEENEARKKKWINPGSVAYKTLTKIVKDTRLLNNLKQCTQCVSTSALEVYHSLYLKYLPKRIHFSYRMMVAGTQLAALDHNNNVGRNQACILSGSNQGEERYKVAWSKVSKKFIARPVYEAKQYSYLKNIMQEVVIRVGNEVMYKPLAMMHMAPTERPTRADIITTRIERSRFK